jgi:anti-sigma factor RsiW
MADTCWNEEVWLLLPWLANGRLQQPDRARVEAHVRECPLCAREVALQQLMCHSLTEPERVTYAPGPSFRKLMDRIDGRHAPLRADRRRAGRLGAFPALAHAAWRPPGLAWAASFLLVVGFAAIAATTYHWSQPLYATHTAPARVAPDVLHIAFVPSLAIGEAGALLRAAGARIVEGPDASGIFGVSPVSSAAQPSAQLRALATRLRADARVRWVQPLPNDASAETPER